LGRNQLKSYFCVHVISKGAISRTAKGTSADGKGPVPVMTKEQVTNIQDAKREAESPEADGETRERSTIQFPYNDLDEAVAVAKAIHENAGVSCSIDQLAAYMKQSMTSGAFRLRVSNAAIFGLTDNERGQVRLTPLGRQLPLHPRRALHALNLSPGATLCAHLRKLQRLHAPGAGGSRKVYA
jgi:hypothetical protein